MAGGTAADVVVIGAGAIGCSVAYYLARAGASVVVVERGEIGREASWASAGMVSARPVGDDPVSRFYRQGAELFPAFAEVIREETGIDIGWWRCGSLRLCRNEAEWPAWEAEYEALRAGQAAVERWSGDAVRVHSPTLAPDTVGALYFPDAGQVRPPRFVRGLAAGAARMGVRFRTGEPVMGLARAGERVTGVLTPSGTLAAETVVVAAGAWSGEVAGFLGRPMTRCAGTPFAVPVAPARGQIVLLEMLPPRVETLVFDGDFYVTPRPDGQVLLGSTVEFAGFDRRTTAEGVTELLRKGLAAAPGLKESRFVTAWAGLRPYAGRDQPPVIGPLPGHEEVVLATGHFRTGISPALITGQMVAEWVTTRQTAIPLAAFALS
jgi:glycine oxidase